jgi:ubiquinone/menaquinone biosynthesis C-methylase UbiE
VVTRKKANMDYDSSDIATRYDAARTLTPEGRRKWQDLLSTHVNRNPMSLIVDLGCGTGRFSELLAAHFAVQVIGIDPSRKMIDQARRKLATRVLFQRALAEALPLAGGCVDIVFMSQVYHHFSDPVAIARECRRVLRDGGYACIRNTTRQNDFTYRRFFPAIQPLIEAELPDRQGIEGTFVRAGLAPTAHQIVTQVAAHDWATFVGKTALRADSFVARLTMEEFDAGMTALRARAAKANLDGAVTEEIDWFVFTKAD